MSQIARPDQSRKEIEKKKYASPISVFFFTLFQHHDSSEKVLEGKPAKGPPPTSVRKVSVTVLDKFFAKSRTSTMLIKSEPSTG